MEGESLRLEDPVHDDGPTIERTTPAGTPWYEWSREIGAVAVTRSTSELEAEISTRWPVTASFVARSPIDALCDALAIGRGDAVIVPGLIPTRIIERFRVRGVVPIAVDVDVRTGAIDPDRLARLLVEDCLLYTDDGEMFELRHLPSGTQIRALYLYHAFGVHAPMSRLRPLVRDYGIELIEDVGDAFGTERLDADEARVAGSWGALAVSDAFGDVGLLLSSDQEADELLNAASASGGVDRARIAAMRHPCLELLDDWREQRRTRARCYRVSFADVLGESCELIRTSQRDAYAYHSYDLRIDKATVLREQLCAQGFACRTFESLALWPHLYAREREWQPAGLPATQRLIEEALALPIHPRMPAGDQEAIVSAVVAMMTCLDARPVLAV